jgi:ribonuclease E
MQESTYTATVRTEHAPALVAAATRAEAWFGEPFLHPDEDPEVALAPGTARRRALDDAQAEMEQGLRRPSNDWKVRYGLMLGLERVLAAETPSTAAGTTLRRHQIDALAGMLTELIAATQRSADENGNGTNGAVAELVEELEDDEEDAEDAELLDEEAEEEESLNGAHPRAGRR